ncbi:MAG: c-type cytochrome [Alphaproteobacteria bacterium]|nr:c-type cytochrome [Alphaproteobacteria bacterium]
MRQTLPVNAEPSPTTQNADTLAEDIRAGEKLYASRCGACHSVDANRIGPMHRGVYGRVAGSVAEYNYSDALIQSGVVWNEQSLDQWLANPQDFIPGQKMGYRLSKEYDHRAIIAFLKTLTPTDATP